MENYKAILEQVESLQRELMTITDYSEDVYQDFEELIADLEELI